MLKAALAHRGTVMLDVDFALRHFQRPRRLDQVLQVPEGSRGAAARINFVPHFEDITVDYDPGTTVNVAMHDGSSLRLRKARRRLRSRLDKAFAISGWWILLRKKKC